MTDKKILIVDDDEAVRNMIAMVLEKEKYSLFFAENGKVGVDKYNELSPDIVILDVFMPVMDGIAFLSEIDINPSTHTAVIAMTGKRDNKKIEACFNYGINCFLHKPFSIYELKGAVKNSIILKDYTQKLEELVSTDIETLGGKVEDLERSNFTLTILRHLESTIADLGVKYLKEPTLDSLKDSIRDILTLIDADAFSIYYSESASNFIKLQSKSYQEMPNLIEQIVMHLKELIGTDDYLIISDIDNYNDDLIESIFNTHKIKSMMFIPIFHGKEIRGFCSFISTNQINKNWIQYFPALNKLNSFVINTSSKE